jgi:uncharacterized Zn-binding protein involved in type VI secretion
MPGLGAAHRNDQVIGVDMHFVMVPSPGGPAPTLLPHPFSGRLSSALSSDVKIEGEDAATKDSVAPNQPKHVPTPPGTSFQRPPSNRGTVSKGSSSVLINGKDAARIVSGSKKVLIG